MVSNLETCEKEHDSSLEKVPSDRKVRVVATRSEDSKLEPGDKDGSKTESTDIAQSASQGEPDGGLPASQHKKHGNLQQNSSRKIRIVLQRKQLDELLYAYNGSRDEADMPFRAKPTVTETEESGLRSDAKSEKVEKSKAYSSNQSFLSTLGTMESYNADFRKEMAKRINDLSLESLERSVFRRDEETNVTVDGSNAAVSVNTEVAHIDLPSNLTIPELETTSPQTFAQLGEDGHTDDVQEDVSATSGTSDSKASTYYLDRQLEKYTSIWDDQNPVASVTEELAKFLLTMNSAAKSTFADIQENRQDSSHVNLELGITKRMQEKDDRQQEETPRGMSTEDELTTGLFHELTVNFDELVEQVFLMKPTEDSEAGEYGNSEEGDSSGNEENEFLSHDETLDEMGRQAVFVFTLLNKGLLAPLQEEDEENSVKGPEQDCGSSIMFAPSDHNSASKESPPGIFASPTPNCEAGHCVPADMFTSVPSESPDEGFNFPTAAVQTCGAYEPSGASEATENGWPSTIGKGKPSTVPRIEFKVQSRQKPSSTARRDDPPLESPRFSHTRLRVLRANLKQRRQRLGHR